MTPYEVKEFVFGQEADKISIDQLLNAVTKTDERIGALKQLAEESTKVCEMVKELVDQRASIIALIDER